MDKNWSISLEHEEYENDKDLVIKNAINAVEQTGPQFYVNIVTPAAFGEPDSYLAPALTNYFGETINQKFIDQCGCGGFVLRVWKNS
ncbi:CGCGG family rSAM-modified RiPP protein [Neobacillus niacini]|uniref:CGCGG family putative rSAM-modified RiPP protein n=1 Tax=Neobacillus niacini TaxID=86668 RepID=UPI002FFD7B06